MNREKRPHLTKEERFPKCYKDAEKVIKQVKLCKSNFKTILANSRLRGAYMKRIYSMSFNILKHYDYIQKINDEIHITEKENIPRDKASVLIYEIIFGRGELIGTCKPVVIMKRYYDEIMKVHEKLQSSGVVTSTMKEFDLPRYARVHTIATTVPYVVKDLLSYGFQQIFYPDDISEEDYINQVKSLQKWTFMIDYHFKDLLVFAHDENLVTSELYQQGHIFLQDKSSYIPVKVLNPEPGSAVIDACAAPGMKALHIAAKMKNKGTLFAYERDTHRFEALKGMISCGNVKISKLFCTDFREIEPNDPTFSSLDYILLDPSCSGSGMVNRMDEVTNTDDLKNEERLYKLGRFQIILLKHALKFPSVKRVVYSTCSIHEEENEFVVHEALTAFRNEFKLVPAMPDWPERGVDKYEYGKMCLRTVPEKHLTNGFFVAVFERYNYIPLVAKSRKGKRRFKNDARYNENEENIAYVDGNENSHITHLSKIENVREIEDEKYGEKCNYSSENVFGKSFEIPSNGNTKPISDIRHENYHTATKDERSGNKEIAADSLEKSMSFKLEASSPFVDNMSVRYDNIDEKYLSKKKRKKKDENNLLHPNKDTDLNLELKCKNSKKHKKDRLNLNTSVIEENFLLPLEENGLKQFNSNENQEVVDIVKHKNKKRKSKYKDCEIDDCSLLPIAESDKISIVVDSVKKHKKKKHKSKDENYETIDCHSMTTAELNEQRINASNAEKHNKNKQKSEGENLDCCSTDTAKFNETLIVVDSVKKHKEKKHKSKDKDNNNIDCFTTVVDEAKQKKNLHKQGISCHSKITAESNETSIAVDGMKKYKKKKKSKDKNCEDLYSSPIIAVPNEISIESSFENSETTRKKHKKHKHSKDSGGYRNENLYRKNEETNEIENIYTTNSGN